MLLRSLGSLYRSFENFAFRSCTTSGSYSWRWASIRTPAPPSSGSCPNRFRLYFFSLLSLICYGFFSLLWASVMFPKKKELTESFFIDFTLSFSTSLFRHGGQGEYISLSLLFSIYPPLSLSLYMYIYIPCLLQGDYKTGLHLLLCYFAMGDREKMKKGFQQILEIPLGRKKIKRETKEKLFIILEPFQRCIWLYSSHIFE